MQSNIALSKMGISNMKLQLIASKVVLVATVSMTSMVMATSASASGRCGGAYSVDTATTLTEVARRCNVNLSALYEANPGVDPNHVIPGERLSIPSELDRFSSSNSYFAPSSSGDGNATTSSTPSYADRRGSDIRHTDDDGLPIIYDDLRYEDDENFTRQQIRIRDTRVSAASPLWMQPETGGGGRYLVNDRLSYQKLSANRIHNAGNGFSVPAIVNTGSAATLTSTGNNSTTHLIECPVLRSSDGSKIHQVRKIISTPESTFVEIKDNANGQGFDCTLLSAFAVERSFSQETSSNVLPAKFTSPKLSGATYNLPDYGRIGVSPKAISVGEAFSLSGIVTSSAENGCLSLVTNNNRLWRLDSEQPSSELVGKKVTVWGTAGSAGTCGGGASMKVSHAVYAEPWRK